MAKITLTVNGEARALDIDPDTPLLWALRDHLNLVGTKFGCGIGACGACTVHLDGVARRSCALPVSTIAGRACRRQCHLSSDRPTHSPPAIQRRRLATRLNRATSEPINRDAR